MHSANDFRSFTSPESVTLITESFPQVLRKVHSSLMIESTPGLFVELWTQEMKFSAAFLGLLTSELNLETWLEEGVVLWDSKVHLEHGHIGVVSEPEDVQSLWEPIVVLELLHGGMLIQI